MKSKHKRRQFRWFLFLWMSLVYLWGVMVMLSAADVREYTGTLSLILFSVLMLVHTGIYWIGVARIQWRSWQLLFFAVQGVFAFVMSMIIGSDVGVTVGLYLALIAVAVGIVQETGVDRHLTSAVVAGYLVLFSLNLGLKGFHGLFNWASVRALLLYSGPLVLLVVGYALLFIRQSRAHEHVQVLLSRLEVAHIQLADSVDRIEDLALMAERQRMARELHDTLAQGLTGLILQLEAVDLHLTSQRAARAREILQDALARARATMADARCAIDDLRVNDTMREGLTEGVQEEIRRFTTATGIPCISDLDALSTIPVAVCEHALRVVTEGLTNIARHAQANRVWVSAEQQGSMLTLEVRDDGIGFELGRTTEHIGHYGLLGMRERARLAGGSLEIISRPLAGTTIRFQLPGNKEGSGA